MGDLKRIAKLPEVKSAVLTDMAGGFLDALREPDGESVAAVTGFLTSTMNRAGEDLGLGTLRGISFSGQARGCLIVVQGSSVTTMFVEPPTSIPAVEKAFDMPPQGQ
jgi:hypothetical protein